MELEPSNPKKPMPGDLVRLEGRRGFFIVLESLPLVGLARVRPAAQLRSLGPFPFSELTVIEFESEDDG